jgi:hypothetical protein
MSKSDRVVVVLAFVILLIGCTGTTVVPQLVPFTQTVSVTQPAPTLIPPSACASATPICNCDIVQFDVLKPPASIQVVKVAPENVELTWRVKNKPTTVSCQWGEAGRETTLLRAASEQSSINVPVKLTWMANDEYNLSVKVQLGWGSYTLNWRLVLPNTGLPTGPELQAEVNVVPPTPIPTRTPTPTITPCPTETYQCNCRQVTAGRDTQTVCDECTRQRCR